MITLYNKIERHKPQKLGEFWLEFIRNTIDPVLLPYLVLAPHCHKQRGMLSYRRWILGYGLETIILQKVPVRPYTHSCQPFLFPWHLESLRSPK